jgi:hypothetical protein
MDDNQAATRRAEVQVWDEHSNPPVDTLCGTWGITDWGEGLCYIVWLESGQELHVWLKGVPESDTDRQVRRLVIQ